MAITLSMMFPTNTKANNTDFIVLNNGMQIDTSEIAVETNLVNEEVFYLEDEHGNPEKFVQEIYESVIPKARTINNLGQTVDTKVSLAVVRAAHTVSDSEYDSTSSYKFYGEISYTSSDSSVGTVYNLTSVYGHASTSDSRVSLSDYYVLIGQSGISTAGGKVQTKKVDIVSYQTFNLTTNYGWYPVGVWAGFGIAVGQTQYYTINRFSPSWSGSFTLNI